MNRNLRMLYREIPAMTCKAGCGDCCGPVPFKPEEWKRVADRVPAGASISNFGASTMATKPGTLDCAFKTDGGCAVYADRPFICRLFGAAKDDRLTCTHGCAPSRRLSAAKAASLTKRYHAA